MFGDDTGTGGLREGAAGSIADPLENWRAFGEGVEGGGGLEDEGFFGGGADGGGGLGFGVPDGGGGLGFMTRGEGSEFGGGGFVLAGACPEVNGDIVPTGLSSESISSIYAAISSSSSLLASNTA